MKHSKSFTFLYTSLVYLILTGYGNISCQEIVGTAGDLFKTQNGSLSFTIGEPVVETYEGANKILTQGFQQSNLIVTEIEELSGLDFAISAFPNPASVFVKIRITKENLTGMQYQLYELNGKLLLQKQIEGTETEIPFTDLPPAEYILRILINSKALKSFKIVKTQ